MSSFHLGPTHISFSNFVIVDNSYPPKDFLARNLDFSLLPFCRLASIIIFIRQASGGPLVMGIFIFDGEVVSCQSAFIMRENVRLFYDFKVP